MIISLTFKTPDVTLEPLAEAVRAHMATLTIGEEAMDEEMLDMAREDQHDELDLALKRYVRYGEYVTILINTETGEATVQEVVD